MEGKIPVPIRSDRIGVVIGKGGVNKRRIEETFGVTIEVDDKRGIVYLIPGRDSSPFRVLKAKKAIEAISLGFSVEDALSLSEDLVDFDTIDISESARNRNDLVRIKSRIIGTRGRFKKTLEEMTGARIVVSDKMVGVIGDYEQIRVVREAIQRILRGQSHRSVIQFLEDETRILKRRRIELWEKWSHF
ncbi:MAG: RNA-processing protein [Thermoprotei archaeon]|nr:MAG: RNA-processing protein [Thermoprotei archaeon]